MKNFGSIIIVVIAAFLIFSAGFHVILWYDGGIATIIPKQRLTFADTIIPLDTAEALYYDGILSIYLERKLRDSGYFARIIFEEETDRIWENLRLESMRLEALEREYFSEKNNNDLRLQSRAHTDQRNEISNTN